MNLQHHLPPLRRHSKWFWLGIVAIVVVVVAIAVPLAVVILPQRNRNDRPATNILIPLYIYPLNESSWSPLYDAVSRRPDLNFTVIVNPNSGPGNGPDPDPKYTTSIRQLNSYPNIETVGYVRLGYATRNLTDVTREVSVYAGWSGKSTSLSMHGIFFDEAPHVYSAEAVDFLRAADRFAKGSSGLQGRRTIIHNPGVVPDSRFNSTDVDMTVIFEESYAKWQDQDQTKPLDLLPKTRGAYSIMIHSMPAMSNSTMGQFVDKVAGLAKNVFLTSLHVDFYNSFATDWLDFVGQTPA
ncbi:hypothetical protein ED733_002676 [Metarhizium rileyi]|uniref:Spherulin 4-like cell surface protein n=1 Tax=Metarhizium rileyi (strain RCEF 4871) TaxID=1649241 RepID=A0A5C6G4L8_METRR|nr:hypothetical protein ED733_002676 [Metarhizium rileyi]